MKDKSAYMQRLAASLLSAAWRQSVDPRRLKRDAWIKHKPKDMGKREMTRMCGSWAAVLRAVRSAFIELDLDYSPEADLSEQVDFDVVANKIAEKLSQAEQPREKKKEFSGADPVEHQRLRDQVSGLKAERLNLLRRLDKAERLMGAFSVMRQRESPEMDKPGQLDTGRRLGTAGLLLSDWHIGDVVSLEATNGINVFNQDIAESRVDSLLRGFRWTVDLWKQGYQLDRLVIGVLGDMVSGWIHEEQLHGNSMSPPQEVVYCADLLERALHWIISMGWKQVDVVCMVGNHGRTTRKIHHSNRGTTNFEWILYHDLANRLSSDRVHFIIPNSEFAYTDIAMKIRWAHGDFFKYSRGIGGITIPMNKAIAAQDRAIAADLTCFGHWHQYLSLPHVLSNGTLKGYDAFAAYHGFAPEPPSQTAFVVDHDRGFPWAKRIWVGSD